VDGSVGIIVVHGPDDDVVDDEFGYDDDEIN
jgi:hypothetical protein